MEQHENIVRALADFALDAVLDFFDAESPGCTHDICVDDGDNLFDLIVGESFILAHLVCVGLDDGVPDFVRRVLGLRPVAFDDVAGRVLVGVRESGVIWHLCHSVSFLIYLVYLVDRDVYPV